VEFSTKKETLSDGTLVKAQIWDTGNNNELLWFLTAPLAGQERYRSVTSA